MDSSMIFFSVKQKCREFLAFNSPEVRFLVNSSSCSNKKSYKRQSRTLMGSVFLWSDAMATICFAGRSVQLPFEGSVYFFGKPADVNDGWIRYVRAVQWHIQHKQPSASQGTIVRNDSHMCVCAAYTSHSYYSRVVFISLKASDCVATIRGWRLFEYGSFDSVLDRWLLSQNKLTRTTERLHSWYCAKLDQPNIN